jgi:predicted chitinase
VAAGSSPVSGGGAATSAATGATVVDGQGPYDVIFYEKWGTINHHQFATKAQAEQFAEEFRHGVWSTQDGTIKKIEIKSLASNSRPGKPTVSVSGLKDYNPITILTTKDLRKSIAGLPAARADVWAKPLNDAMVKYGITSPQRQAAFLAQLSLESGRMKYVNEIASGSAYDAAVNRNKAVRLGNTQFGDGPTYKGGGLLQITGRANYRAAGKALGIDLENHPELIERPDVAAQAAAWFWKTHGLNELADQANTYTGFDKISNIINRGDPDKPALHQQQRRDAWDRARKALTSVNPPASATPAPAENSPLP